MGKIKIWANSLMESVRISSSSLLASKPPINSSSTAFSPRHFYSLNSKRIGACRIACDHSCFEIKSVTYRPPGTEVDLLNGVSFSLPEKSFGLIFGRSGSGKTTLLQLIAGLSKPTSGSIYVQRYGEDGNPNQCPTLLQPRRVGIVFQFPERFFIADNILDEIIFGWPRQRAGLQLREILASRLQKAMTSVGLTGIPLDKDPQSLSGGYKRRLALAIQLVQTPDLLVLDEPLAGLDWKARADVVKLLRDLKKELALLVVSHDLKELAPLVDQSWRMEMGGILKRECLPI
ncbi:ABC transporter I family member 11, chloroplastic-like [Salvia splendens]|uniref:ABC transporter I family member 11, chloroplastic-like n=1 Tax=Salvia splendens TaxID=180675 RepID=UPI001C2769D3|nr:ABC transporter I family member 11, chloroplastic-like [Salvia splendens]